MAKHYFCPVCGGVSPLAGVCQLEGCDLHGQPLQECDCENPDSHKKEAEVSEEEPEAEEEPKA